MGGHTVTVFGATGFLGRYIVNRMARSGCTVVVPFREEMAKRHLKVSGDLGRVVFMEWDLRNTASIEESVRHSDIVFNLIGREYSTKNFDLEDVHVEGTSRIASAVAKYDVDRFIQVSSHSAHPQSPSEFYRTKAQGEKVARDIFPETTIVRPAPMFGFEDNLLHRLAGVTNVIHSNHLQERFSPVHVIDVGEALEKIGMDDSTAGETFELYGPKEYSMKEISDLVDKEILKHRRHVHVPKAIMAPLLALANRVLWWPVGSRDQVEREFLDQIIDKNAKTFKDLDIEPGDIANFTFKYLVSLAPSCSTHAENEEPAADSHCSNITAHQPTTTYHLCLSVRSEKRRSICTCLMTNRYCTSSLARVALWMHALNCTYQVTARKRLSRVQYAMLVLPSWNAYASHSSLCVPQQAESYRTP